MKEKVLIVEDQFVEADYLRLMLAKNGYQVCAIARSVSQAIEIIKDEKPGIVLLDIFLTGKLTGIDLGRQLQQDHIAFVYLSANSNEEVLAAAKATQPYGFLVKPFREKDLVVTLEIARYRHEHSMESRLLKEAVLQKQLTATSKASGTCQQKLLNIAEMIQPHLPFDFLSAGLNQIGEASGNTTSFLRIGFDEYQTIGIKELLLIAGITIEELFHLRAAEKTAETPTFYNDAAFKTVCRYRSLKSLVADTFNMQSHLSVPLYLSDGTVFDFCFYSRRPDTYNLEHLELISRLQHTWEKSIESILISNPIPKSSNPSGPIQAGQNPAAHPLFDDIIGKSHLLLNVFDLMTSVAPSDTSVLILGETGTGKEKIADYIHQLSPRRGKPFVKVNCAALPPALIESELFGHEKGAFTGATDKRIGKFEQADKGTIFLDEIGEMPLELQVKLLRVLQEQEVERIGARSLIKIDVRIIAATNRNLEKEVAEGRFRLDVYYRLNVFPILLPPLRERRDDIPLLVSYFIHHYNQKTGKRIVGLSEKGLKKLMAYDWPGNIRQLKHLIERNVLLTRGTTIEDIVLPVVTPKQVSTAMEGTGIKTIHENERDHILSVLKKCNGKIWGTGAAAEILNIPPSTLKSKMKKLGIKREYTE